jgi:hypothetical protein
MPVVRIEEVVVRVFVYSYPMKLMVCRSCGDAVQLRREMRQCLCGASCGHYLEDDSTVEQTEGSISLALHNHDLSTALAAFDQAPQDWHPLMVLRAYVNPLCENDVRYVASTKDPAG